LAKSQQVEIANSALVANCPNGDELSTATGGSFCVVFEENTWNTNQQKPFHPKTKEVLFVEMIFLRFFHLIG